MYEKYRNTGDWNIRRIWTDIQHTTPRVYLMCLLHAYRFNRNSWWSRVSVPTLIIHGKRDAIIPVQYALKVASDIPNAQLDLIEHAGHILPLNNSEEICVRIKQFLEKTT